MIWDICTLCDPTMTEIQLSLINFPHHEALLSIFNGFSNNFEFTADGVFRRIASPLCPDCGSPMSHNGFNTYRKRHLGETKIGRYLCGDCGKSVEEDRTFWDNLKGGFFDILTLTPHTVGNILNPSFPSRSRTFFGTSEIKVRSPILT